MKTRSQYIYLLPGSSKCSIIMKVRDGRRIFVGTMNGVEQIAAPTHRAALDGLFRRFIASQAA